MCAQGTALQMLPRIVEHYGSGRFIKQQMVSACHLAVKSAFSKVSFHSSREPLGVAHRPHLGATHGTGTPLAKLQTAVLSACTVITLTVMNGQQITHDAVQQTVLEWASAIREMEHGSQGWGKSGTSSVCSSSQFHGGTLRLCSAGAHLKAALPERPPQPSTPRYQKIFPSTRAPRGPRLGCWEMG